VSLVESKLAAVTRERDELKRALASDADKEASVIAVKLRREGEALALKVSQLEEKLKRVRAEKKEADSERTDLKARLLTTEQLLDRKVERLKQLESTERQTTDSLTSMKTVTESTSKQLERTQQELQAAQRRSQELQTQLEQSWREQATLKKALADADAKGDEAVRVAVAAARSEWQQGVGSAIDDANQTIVGLRQTLLEARASSQRAQERSAWREEELRAEMAALQSRLQAAEQRAADFAATIPDATRPLLRQLEAAQASSAAREASWTAARQALERRAAEADERAAAAEAAAAEATSSASEARARASTASGLAERRAAELATMRGKVEKLEQRAADAERLLADANLALTETRAQYESLVERARNKEARLRAELEQARTDADACARELRQQIAAASAPSAAAAPAAAKLAVVDEALPLIEMNDDAADKRTAAAAAGDAQRRAALLQTAGDVGVHSMASEAAASWRDGEASALRQQAQMLQRTVHALETELVQASALSERLAALQHELAAAQAALAVAREREDALLELLGEKEEALDEMRMDLLDCKGIYREQVVELVERVAALEQMNASLKTGLK
jgi:TATA element modulatory factor